MDALSNLFHHTPPRFRADELRVWQKNVAEKINALCTFSYTDLVRMELHAQPRFQKYLNAIFELPEILQVMVDDDKVVRIADVVFRFQLVFHELVQFIEIDVREKL